MELTINIDEKELKEIIENFDYLKDDILGCCDLNSDCPDYSINILEKVMGAYDEMHVVEDTEIQEGMDRRKDWKEFNKQVEKHIQAYAEVQYKNNTGNKQAEEYSVDDCWKQIERYMGRHEVAVRGEIELLRDVIKVGHYASFIYHKLKKKHNLQDLY